MLALDVRPTDRSGQTVDRVAAVLRALSASADDGASTTTLARSAGLPRSSAHRMLESLHKAGLVDRDTRSGRWFLGPEMYLMGTTAAARYQVSERARAAVHRLATSTGESAFYSVRRADETVVLLREDGSFPVRSFVLFEGARFPLGVVSAGLAILAYLDDDEIADYLGRTDLTVDYTCNHSAAAIRTRVAATREHGWSLNPGPIVEGSWGMAAAVFRDNAPIAALTLTGVATRFRPGPASADGGTPAVRLIGANHPMSSCTGGTTTVRCADPRTVLRRHNRRQALCTAAVASRRVGGTRQRACHCWGS
jgi:DNA-binding IclR family transcriptional regulator